MTIKLKDKSKIIVNKPKKVADILNAVLKTESKADKNKEHFWGIYLNSRNIVKRIELIGLGIIDTGIIHPRETFYPAIASLCTSIIIAHNHPSGDPEPSEDDLIITKRLVEAGKILGIEVLDHIIVVKNGFYSFKDNKLI